jgi:hypothetical protein
LELIRRVLQIYEYANIAAENTLRERGILSISDPLARIRERAGVRAPVHGFFQTFGFWLAPND